MNEKTAPTKVIGKIEGPTKRVILFFPEEPANLHNICFYSPVDGHGEASVSYYWSLRNPPKDAMAAAVATYQKQTGTELRVVLRDSCIMRNARWALARAIHTA